MKTNKELYIHTGKRRLVATSWGMVLAIATQSALAQPAEEALAERVQQLENELEAIKEQAKATQEASAAMRPHEANTVAGNLKGGRIGFQSEDGDFTFQLNGRILLDTAWADADGRDLGQETDFRATRLAASGTLYRDWVYKFQYDFTSDGASGIKDAYLKYLGFQPAGNQLVLSVGNQFQPFGLEGQQSSKYTTMMELSAPTGALGAGARRMGVRADLYSDLWHFAAGVAQRVPGSEDSPQDGDDPVDLAAQFFVDPINSPGNLVHMGGSVRRHWNQDLDAFGVRARAENRVDGFRPLDTIADNIDGSSDGFTGAGLEFAYTNGPFNMMAEYLWQQYDELENAGSLSGAEPLFAGGYVQGTYFLTGESRPYSHAAGVFAAPKPLNPLSAGGIGAWSVAGRLSTLDLNDDGVDGGEMDIAQLGLHWNPEQRLRFMLDVGKAFVDGGPYDDSDPVFVQARTQVEW